MSFSRFKPDYSNNSQGFTIIELMIATAVFSVVLLLCATALITIGNMYRRGITSSAAQETARQIMSQLQNDIQYSSGEFHSLEAITGYKGFCVGNNRYVMKEGTPSNTYTSLTVENINNCSALALSEPSASAKEMLGVNMRLLETVAEEDPIAPSAVLLVVNVAFGDYDLLNSVNKNCNGGPGSQFCATSKLVSNASKRIQ